MLRQLQLKFGAFASSGKGCKAPEPPCGVREACAERLTSLGHYRCRLLHLSNAGTYQTGGSYEEFTDCGL